MQSQWATLLRFQLHMLGPFIDTITLLGLETEVAHVIIYIETMRWAVRSFEAIHVSPCPTSCTWFTASYRHLSEHL